MNGIVLFVDDEGNVLMSVRRLMVEWLEDRGYAIETATSVAQALQLVEAAPAKYHVVVSDLKMPNQVGTVLLGQVQSRWPEISTILMTGYAETEEIKKAIKAGIVAFIQKPWDPEMLQAEIGKALELAALRRKNREFMETLVNEVRWSRKIHQTILMDSSRPHVGQGFGMAYRPAQGVVEGGGDFFQVLWQNGDSTGVCLGTIDVKGAQSTYFALLIRDLLKGQISLGPGKALPGPAKLLEVLNHAIMGDHLELPGCFLTLTICASDAGKHSMTVASAGGESFFMIRNGVSEEHHLPSPGLGYRDSLLYQDRVFPFAKGDRMVLASRPLVGDAQILRKLESVLLRPIGNNQSLEGAAAKILDEVLGPDPLPVDATLLLLEAAN